MAIVNFSGPNFPEIFLQKISFKRWLKQVGDTVVSGEVLCEIANGPKIAPIKTPTSGVLIELLADEGSMLTPRQLLARIRTEEPASVEAIKETANLAPPAESPQPAPEVQPEPAHPPVAMPAPEPEPEPVDSQDEAAASSAAQALEQIELISNKIEVLTDAINSAQQSRVAEKLQILKTLEDSATSKINDINSSVKKIGAQLDTLDDQLRIIANHFLSTIDALHIAQVKTQEEVAKICEVNSTEDHKFSAELAELHEMLAALQK